MGVVVLISGTGSNLLAILEAGVAVTAVLADRECAGLEHARSRGIPAVVVLPSAGEPRAVYDAGLATAVAAYSPVIVVLAGWRRILTMSFLSKYRVLNLHPALPGAYPGLHAIERALADRVPETGVMVHWVPDEGVDVGPTLFVERVPLLASDTLEDLAARVHEVEHRLLPQAIRYAMSAT